MPKKEVAEEIRVGRSSLGSAGQAGWQQSKEVKEGSTPQEAKFLLNPRWKLKQWMKPAPSRSLADVPQELHLEMYRLAATHRCCLLTSLFPALPRKKLATQATPLVLRFFSLATLFLSGIFSCSK